MSKLGDLGAVIRDTAKVADKVRPGVRVRIRLRLKPSPRLQNSPATYHGANSQCPARRSPGAGMTPKRGWGLLQARHGQMLCQGLPSSFSTARTGGWCCHSGGHQWQPSATAD